MPPYLGHPSYKSARGNKLKRLHIFLQGVISGEKKPFSSKNLRSPVQQAIDAVRSPLEYFSLYFTEDFYESTSECTNQYHFSTKGKYLRTSAQEIKQLFGRHVIVGCVRYPRLRKYWQRGFRLSVIADIMPRDLFFTLRTALHVVDTNNVIEDANKNRLWKVQPIIDVVRGTVCV
ncbi:hypothetical protein C0J52_02756 [Blattella germanica]|nr:hypothetical protein C0J52_02756 [Blattella germanica]